MSSNDLEELPVPAPVLAAQQKAELARIWLADGEQVVTLSSRLWENPGAWGLMLVDLARHVAAAYEDKGFDREHTLASIWAAMDAEWAASTDDPRRTRTDN